MEVLQRCVVGSFCVGLAACGASHPKPGIVAQNWSENTEQLGIKAIYPPRANMEVGDLYIVRSAKSGTDLKTEDYVHSSIWFDRIDLKKELVGKASSIHFTSAVKVTDGSGKETTAWQTPALNITEGSTTTKINNLVAFPGFTFASLAESEIGVNVASSAFGAAFGGGRKSAYTVAYSVPAAETYGVPYLAAKKAFKGYTQLELTELEKAAKALILPPSSKRTGTTPVLVLITELYFARALDVVVSSSEATNAQFSALTLSMVELSEKKSAIEEKLLALKNRQTPAPQGTALAGDGTPPAPEGTGAQSEADKRIELQLQAELQQVNAQMNAKASQIAPNMPGVTGSVVRSSASSVTLRQAFDVPVAIGYKGIRFSIPELAPVPGDTDTPALVVPLTVSQAK
ncbi:hypothetical protein [Pseudomonas gingeri]